MYMERQKVNHLWKIIEWEKSVYWIQDKVCIVKAMVFPAVMYRCKSRSIKKAEGQRTDAFELWCWRRLLRVPWTARRSNQSILKEISPGAKAETPVLWPPHAKSWLIGKDSEAGRDWGQEEKGTTEDEMAGWHHWLNGRESQWTPGVGVGQGGLACCDSWGRKESDRTEWLIWSDLIWYLPLRVIQFFHQIHRIWWFTMGHLLQCYSTVSLPLCICIDRLIDVYR